MNVLPLLVPTFFLEGESAGRSQGNILSLILETILEPKNHELANCMKMWEENRETTTLLFSLKGLEISYYIKKEEDK